MRRKSSLVQTCSSSQRLRGAKLTPQHAQITSWGFRGFGRLLPYGSRSTATATAPALRILAKRAPPPHEVSLPRAHVNQSGQKQAWQLANCGQPIQQGAATQLNLNASCLACAGGEFEVYCWRVPRPGSKAKKYWTFPYVAHATWGEARHSRWTCRTWPSSASRSCMSCTAWAPPPRPPATGALGGAPTTRRALAKQRGKLWVSEWASASVGALVSECEYV